MSKKTVWFVLLLLLTLPVIVQAENRSEYFMGVNLGNSWGDMDAGGYNEQGDFGNTGDDSDSVFMGEVVMGKLCGPWRTELSLAKHGTFEFTTDSYQGGMERPDIPDTLLRVAVLDIPEQPEIPPESYEYDTEIDNLTLMLSVYYDFMVGTDQRWMPYVGAGIGAARNDVDVTDGVVSGDDDETDFAWQLAAGVGYKMTQAVDLQVGYRYIDFGEADISLSSDLEDFSAGNFKADLTAHEMFVGLRWKFGAVTP